jgi:hypothetical protein
MIYPRHLAAPLLACALFGGGAFAAQAPEQTAYNDPQAAVHALTQAAQAHDKAALRQIFGPGFRELLTGDNVQDDKNFNTFTEAVNQKCIVTPGAETNQLTLELGADAWPFPIPLVKGDKGWFFDTDAGKQEIINRHIGGDEMYAIAVCHAYVQAQRQYASSHKDAKGAGEYALKLRSTPGKKDGLCWRSTGVEAPPPLSPVVMDAEVAGTVGTSDVPTPFHGYLFKILKRQGSAAPGGKENYLVKGKMERGFALVAYPAQWGRSGIMTFIVGPDGQLFQSDLGEKTAQIAGRMKEYNPTENWALVTEDGVKDWETALVE